MNIRHLIGLHRFVKENLLCGFSLGKSQNKYNEVYYFLLDINLFDRYIVIALTFEQLRPIMFRNGFLIIVPDIKDELVYVTVFHGCVLFQSKIFTND